MYLATHRRDLRLHSTRFSIARVLAGLMLLAAGCGPFGFIKKVSQPVNRSLAQAKVAGAEELAAYEYWSAVAYFEQARELMGYSEYERALDYGTRAKQLADEAKVKAERVRMGRSVESIATSTPDAPNSSLTDSSTESERRSTEESRDSAIDPAVDPDSKDSSEGDSASNGPFSRANTDRDQVTTPYDSLEHDAEVLIRGGEWR